MTDEAQQPATATSVHVTGVLSHSVSTDGEAALFVLSSPGDNGEERRIALTMPTALLKFFRSVVHEAVMATAKRGVPAGGLLLRFPEEYSIGNSDQMRGQVVIQFDTGRESEAIFVMQNLPGLQFADAIRRDIMPRLTAEERAQARTIGQPQKGIIKPNG